MPDAVLVDSHAGVQTLTLHQPNRLNALSAEMLQALNAALRAAERDSSVRALVLTGAARAFSSGADISEFTFDSRPPDLSDMLRRRVNPVVSRMRSLEKPLLAAGNGGGAGGG